MPHYDMVECELLDSLSILTYLSQCYQVLTNQSNPVILQSADRGGKSGQGDQCHICGRSVYLLERLNLGGRIIHRTCFKCARCEEQLTLASFYETETGQFCCEVCPDEEDSQRKRTLKASTPVKFLTASTSLDIGLHILKENFSLEGVEEKEEAEADQAVLRGHDYTLSSLLPSLQTPPRTISSM